MSELKSELVPNLVVAAALVGAALAATAARQAGWIDADAVNRIVMGGIGLMLAWVGNRMPKRFVPAAQARRVNRVAGWSMAISGLVYAGLWVFAPFDVALWGGCAAVIAGMAVTMGYCLSAARGARAG
ncbi:MAG: ammonium transporter [Brevundimonas sp.]|uniref:ammonium transporter n=1 Tax=Brevundimonas sp. TaxID=1871086 RepID=UPI0018196427|nr:ammonium transporter [Brevundimonas sp.]MBA4805451.1 ammonium transporter [Brevundimonas sp.]